VSPIWSAKKATRGNYEIAQRKGTSKKLKLQPASSLLVTPPEDSHALEVLPSQAWSGTAENAGCQRLDRSKKKHVWAVRRTPREQRRVFLVAEFRERIWKKALAWKRVEKRRRLSPGYLSLKKEGIVPSGKL